MRMTGEFSYTLDLGQLGEHDVQVEWEGYRPVRREVDDYPEMTIARVTIDLCKQILDVTDLLSADTMEELKCESWERFPTKEDIEAEAAEQWMTERADRGDW